MACDEHWRVYVAPSYFYSVDIDVAAMSLVHEVWHLLRRHFARARALCCPKEKHKIVNIAQDLEINQTDELWKRLPDFAVMPKKYNVPPSLTFEEYWRLLENQQDLQSSTLTDGIGPIGPGGGNCGPCTHGHHQPWMLPPPNAAGPDGEKIPGISEIRGNIIIQNTAEAIKDAAARGIGKVPAGWVRWAKEILSPKVNWMEKIPPALQGMMFRVTGQYYQNPFRIGRRQHLSPQIIQPAKLGEAPRLSFIIDTSGSMDDQMLCQAVSEVNGVLQGYGYGIQVTVYFTDAAAAPAQQVTCATQLKPIGGGGTDMGEGFKAIENDFKKDTYAKPAVVIVVTDGYTPWPAVRPDWLDHCFILLLADGTAPSWAVPPDHEVIRTRPDAEDDDDS
jgi:predicted metal-dependent peptidase